MEGKRKFVRVVLVMIISVLVCATLVASMASAANFNGDWKNRDPSARGMVKFTITNGTFHGYGSCSPTPCDWGTTPLVLYSRSVSDPNNIAGTAQYNTGFSKKIITLKMESPTLIKETDYTQFTDNSGRHNYYSENMFVPTQIATPKQKSPMNGAVFSNYPRTTTLTWSPVSGAVNYGVEVQYGAPDYTSWSPFSSKTDLRTTSYTFDFVGAQPGRWRVWAIDANGQASAKSDWWTFRYTR